MSTTPARQDIRAEFAEAADVSLLNDALTIIKARTQLETLVLDQFDERLDRLQQRIDALAADINGTAVSHV